MSFVMPWIRTGLGAAAGSGRAASFPAGASSRPFPPLHIFGYETSAAGKWPGLRLGARAVIAYGPVHLATNAVE